MNLLAGWGIMAYSISSITMGTDPLKGDLKSIPQYPSFKQVGIEDASTIVDFTSKFPPYSDFIYSNLLCWRDENAGNLFSFREDNLIIKTISNECDLNAISILGNHVSNQLLDDLLQNEGHEIKYVPEVVIENASIQQGNISIEEDQNSFDYIYDLPKIKSLDGADLHNRRWEVHKFMRDYPEAEYRELDLDDKEVESELVRIFEAWINLKRSTHSKQEDLCMYACEFDSFTKLYSLRKMFDLISIGVFHGNKMIGFSINERIKPDHAMSWFVKGSTEYRNIFSYLQYVTSVILVDKGILSLNNQMDFGIESLRSAKSSWKPFKHLRKYTLRKQ